MTEVIEHFGAEHALFGIHTRARVRRRATSVVLANSGIVHRVGANRTTVVLARHLAAAGYESLRFDLSGLGDSPERTDGRGWEQSSPLELGAAVAAARRRPGVTDLVLYGNCGGAAKSFWTALKEPSVTGLLFTNPPPPPSDPDFGDWVERSAHGNVLGDRHAESVGEQLSILFDRGVRALFVYAEGDVGERYFEARLARPLRTYLDDGRLRIVSVASTNHTFASDRSRADLVRHAERWLSQNFPDHVAEG